ncbi:MAG: 3-oxoadipate enol-lactonase [Pseudomonadota bacterium]|nr:3-oxoadipate enol-lactonase [Pseudomonadota bacterium]
MNARVSARGASLFTRVDSAERADAPWIVLSNSLAADHTMWDPQIPALTARYHVLRYDTRGHGASDAPEGPYDFDMLIADVIAVMDHHGVERATFMGLSLGGMTGLGLALAHPERLSRLVCCDARADAPEPFVKSWDERIAVIEREGMRGILQGTIERWLVPAFRAANPDVTARVEAMILNTPLTGYKGCAGALKRLDYFKDLHRISVPTLFVVGAEDAGAPPEVMKRMAEMVPGARIAVVTNAAHLPNLDNQAGFHAAIRDFLDLA